MKNDVSRPQQPRGPEEQTFTVQFEGNVPARLECVERTIEKLRRAHLEPTSPLSCWELMRRE
jgi:hypothetical protein